MIELRIKSPWHVQEEAERQLARCKNKVNTMYFNSQPLWFKELC